ncbi:MAG: hypothetical protein R3F20_06855 [Planctomycetota bacterium]
MKTFALGILVGIALGFGIHALVVRDEGREDAPTRPAWATGETRAPTDRKVTERKSEAEEADGPAVAPAHATASRLEPRARHEGVADGRVSAPDGTPIEGVEVLLSAIPSSSLSPLRPLVEPEWEPLEVWIEQARRKEEQRRRESHRGRSDAGGRIHMEGIEPGRAFAVFARKEGWIFGEEATPPTWRVGHPLEIEGRREAVLRLDLVLPDGSRPKRARVLALDPDRFAARDWTPEAPDLSFPVGGITLTIRSGEYFRNGVSLRLEPGVQEQRIELEAQRTLSLTLTSSGEIAPDLFARVYPLVGDERLDATRLDGRPFKAASFVDASASLRFENLEPRRHAIAVFANGEAFPLTDVLVVDMSRGPVEATLEVPPLDRGDFLLVRVEDEVGQPIEDFRARFHARYPGGHSDVTLRGERRGAGTLFARVPWRGAGRQRDDEELAAATFELSVSASAYGETRIPLARGQHEVRVRFVPAGSLRVRVEGLEPAMMIRAEVSVIEEGTTSHGRGGDLVGTDGTFRFTGFQPGRYVCTLLAPLGREGEGNLAIAVSTVTVSAGENEITLAAGRPARLRVLVPDAPEGAFVQFRNDRTDRRLRVFGAGATADDLGHGTYTVSVFGAELGAAYETKTVTVPETTEITLRKR